MGGGGIIDTKLYVNIIRPSYKRPRFIKDCSTGRKTRKKRKKEQQEEDHFIHVIDHKLYTDKIKVKVG
jgi:hypothetical protein